MLEQDSPWLTTIKFLIISARQLAGDFVSPDPRENDKILKFYHWLHLKFRGFFRLYRNKEIHIFARTENTLIESKAVKVSLLPRRDWGCLTPTKSLG